MKPSKFRPPSLVAATLLLAPIACDGGGSKPGGKAAATGKAATTS